MRVHACFSSRVFNEKEKAQLATRDPAPVTIWSLPEVRRFRMNNNIFPRGDEKSSQTRRRVQTAQAGGHNLGPGSARMIWFTLYQHLHHVRPFATSRRRVGGRCGHFPVVSQVCVDFSAIGLDVLNAMCPICWWVKYEWNVDRTDCLKQRLPVMLLFCRWGGRRSQQVRLNFS